MTPERLSPERLAEIERWADSPLLAELKVSKAEEGWIQGGKNTAKVLIAHIRDLEAQVREAREALTKIWSMGHNDDCIFCGLKDTVAVKFAPQPQPWQAENPTATPPSPEGKPLSAREQQRRSFAYGNVHIDNPNVTREMVDRAAERLASEPPSPEVK